MHVLGDLPNLPARMDENEDLLQTKLIMESRRVFAVKQSIQSISKTTARFAMVNWKP